MNTKEKLPIRLLLMPPVVSAGVIGLGTGLAALGVVLRLGGDGAVQIALVWAGTGVVLGFLWGSLIWTEKLARVYEPRLFESVTDATPQKVRIELRDEVDGFLSVNWIDMLEGITMHQLVETAKLLQRNGYNFSHAICGMNKPLTRPQYESLRDTLLAKSFLIRNSKHSRNMGFTLTAPGKSLFNQLASYQEGPLPSLLKVLK